MKNIKKITAAVLTALAVLCLFTTGAFALTENGYTYTVTDGKATVTGYDDTGVPSLTVPDTLGGYPVAAIGQEAFKGFGSLVKVTLPQSVETIGQWAFHNCASLSAVEFEENSRLRTIELSAFLNCSGLEYIEIPEGAKTIGRTAFAGASLKKIVIPSTIETINDVSLTDRDTISGEGVIIIFGGTDEQWASVVENSDNAGLSKFRNVKWYADGALYENDYFNEDMQIAPPASPEKEHYTFAGWCKKGTQTVVTSFGKPSAQGDEFEAKFDIITYTASLIVDGGVWKTIGYTCLDTALNLPAVPAKEGHTGSWSDYTLVYSPEGTKIYAQYKINTYTASFTCGGSTTQVPVIFGQVIPVPEVDEREGYDFTWSPEVPATMPASDLAFTGSYTPKKYIAVFMAEGVKVKEVTYQHGQKSLPESEIPKVPEKTGYTGSWETPSLTPGGTTVNAVYKINSYTLTFAADGFTQSEVYEYNAPVTAPVMPEKSGCEFRWKNVPARMPANDLTVSGAYVSLCTLSINGNTGSRTIDYGEDLHLSVRCPVVPDGAKIVWSASDGNKGEGREFATGNLTSGVTVTVKLVDSDGNIIKDADGNDLVSEEKVEVNGGFFKIIISFFKNLFKADRTVVQK
ncbi:MAG: leucine-rich repeat protein [Clostridia bacterium]|nr:leucine-rich repeat protein [Clostridia bacterium]